MPLDSVRKATDDDKPNAYQAYRSFLAPRHFNHAGFKNNCRRPAACV